MHEVSGHTYDMLYDLIFSTERVVAVIIQNPDDIRPSPSASSLIIGGWFSRRKEQELRQKIAEERHQQVKKLTLDELVQAHPANFELRYTDIHSVEIYHGFFERRLRFRLAASPLKMVKDFTLKKPQVLLAEDLLTKTLKQKFIQK